MNLTSDIVQYPRHARNAYSDKLTWRTERVILWEIHFRLEVASIVWRVWVENNNGYHPLENIVVNELDVRP
jgi:hypothetical protein